MAIKKEVKKEVETEKEREREIERVIREAFCPDEAVCVGSDVCNNPQAAEELLELCAYAALDGVSLVAIYIPTGEVVAVAFNKIQVPADDSTEKSFFERFAEERCTQESARSLINFMANVDERCNLFEKYEYPFRYNVDCSLEIMFLATLREHRRHGLGTLLCKESIRLAAKLRNGVVHGMTPEDLGAKYSNLLPQELPKTYPKICQAILTSKASQKVGAALDFTVDLRVSYEEFVFDGKTYADRIGPLSPCCELVSKMVHAI
ncbi:hypothetical protein EVAR_38203_1 [Eumeta japonica]|uniref:N-acetyltransferase domain-containing protein n=1 Tax=Eumeta variegata TaxID=151549 RepID=A0A4C1WH27_EUMVA|nr:hypothetical protein EVAR_38203_1 [Eumeta japonica]